MKVIVLALLLAFSLEAQAQKAQEILVVATDAQVQSSTELVNAIKQHHTGVVTVRNELPEMLDYVAVMMIRPWGGEFNGLWLDSVQQARLIEYVQSGGKFYAEGADFRSTSSVHPDTSDNQFWDFIGDSLEGVAALEFAVDRV